LAGAAGFCGSVRRIFPVPLTGRPRHSPSRFSLCPASPVHPLWDEDGLGAPNTVLGRAEMSFEGRDRNGFLVRNAPNSFEGRGLRCSYFCFRQTWMRTALEHLDFAPLMLPEAGRHRRVYSSARWRCMTRRRAVRISIPARSL
jgi:hypothetical protein